MQDTYEREKARDFKCPLCSENMTSLKEFTSHLRGHNEVKPSADPSDPTGQAKVYHCCLCGKMLSSFSSLDRHMLVHSGERPFSCEVCGQTFTTNGNMHRHRRTHNIRDSCESDGSGGSASKKMRKRKGGPAVVSPLEKKERAEDSEPAAPLKCPICPETFYTEISIEVHVLSFHPGKEIRCEECAHPCPSYNYYKLHRNMFHYRPQLGATAAFPQFPGSGLLLPRHESPAPVPALPLLSPAKREPEPDRDITAELNTSFCSEAGGSQDDDPVLKEMKLKGEFPCRLCPAVFPNLRALKGHNKEHLILPPFECNVGTCRYTTADKSALLQHMRGHTGQKPFECKICNFGFTTKANCERHVKNKHNKNTKEDVRDHIIIHEGDEESNSYTEHSKDPFLLARHDNSYENDVMTAGSTIFPPTPPRSSAFIPYRPFDVDCKPEKIKSEEVEDAPLDLSKPAFENLTEKLTATSPHDLKPDAQDNNNLPYHERLNTPAAAFPAPRFPFSLPFLTGGAGGQLVPGLPGWPPGLALPAAPTFPFNPMHLAALLAAKNEELKKSCSAVEESAAAALHGLGGGIAGMADLAAGRGFLPQLSPASRGPASPVPSPHKSVQPQLQPDQESNYKMIIKNGVLMRKQKQRRYRTERPYGCDQCSARFTLRSNMDRHMKQQHPQTYSQKPRSGPGRKPNFQDDELVSSGPPNAKEEDLELIRKEETQKDGFESEEEEGFLDEEEDEQNLIIDDLDSLPKSNEHQTFTNISQYFGDGKECADIEAGSESSNGSEEKKKSAYSSAPHKMSCPYCQRKFPWSSSLKRHILTHTGQKPFKCTECPLWFTTKSNCDRHILRKHGNNNNIDEKDYDCVEEGMCSGGEEEDQGFTLQQLQAEFPPRRDSTSDSAPYKCHICDDGFSERQAAIAHIKTEHAAEYKSLLEKGAFDSPEDVVPQPAESGEELYDHLRGKFPDYVNRKIICLFCSRKFWSAEDLRRHVRTHTGERPFSCDICSRRFTLKHSMLRHKKKHDSGLSSAGEASDCDDSLSVHSSSGGRSSPEQQQQPSPAQPGLQLYDQKRANLMAKISRLNCAVPELPAQQ